MVEQVIFKIDKKLKDKAMKRAKNEGMPFSTVLKRVTQAYADNELDVSVSYSPRLIRDVREAEKEVRAGKILRGDLDTLVKKV